jgi:hypothetical protein
MILVGTGGPASLEQHQGKSKCVQAVRRQRDEAKHGRVRTLFDLGIAKQPENSSDLGPQRVLAPPPILATSLREVLTPNTCDGPSRCEDKTQIGTSPAPSIIDVDAGEDEATLEDLPVPTADLPGDLPYPSSLQESRHQKSNKCWGIHVPIPQKMTPYTAYPFGMHDNHVLPWNIHIINEKLYLQSTECRKAVSTPEVCLACRQLRTHSILEGILDRITMGIHENTPHNFQPIAGLTEIIKRKTGTIDLMRVDKMNATRKLAV